MWPFKRSRGGEEQRALSEWPWDTGPAPFSARAVSVERALSLVPVFGAARLLADNIAGLTPKLYTAGVKGVPKLQPTPSLFVNPSVHGTMFDWLHRAVTSMALWGDAVGLVTERNYYGFPTMAEWLDPATVAVNESALTGQGSYMNPLWTWWGRPVATENLIHIPWFCLPYRIRGLSPIGAYAVAANVGLGAQEYAAAWFENGGVPPGTFRNSNQRVPKEDADEITARVTRRLQSRQPLVYGNDWEYVPIAIKPNEAQFIETSRLTATQIAVIYGVPPEKIGGQTGETMTYSNVEQNSLDFLTFSLRPWLIRIEAALSNLFPRGTFVKFDTAELLRVDAKTQAEIDRISLGPSEPYRTADEVRADHDWPPMPKPPPPPAPPPLVPIAAPQELPPLNGNTPMPAVMKGNNNVGNS